ncbi:MAG: hypothetical protein FWE70_00875 [Oscillospiraceae bacterium]|nr:hypothetical protein [Oscillospiraceae bacterium]
MVSSGDRKILRELAKARAELAATDENKERAARARDINSLRPSRPIVWIEEIPWHEMDIDGELKTVCEGEEARRIEYGLRTTLFRWRHFRADMVVEDAYYVYKAFTATDTGFRTKETILAKDERNHIVSHSYEDVMDTEEKLGVLKKTVVTAYPEKDEANLAVAQDMFGDIMPIKMRGYGIYCNTWDDISRVRGVGPVLLDMVDNPGFVHKMVSRLMDITVDRYEQMESLGLLDFDTASVHCTPAAVDGLPTADYDGGKVRFKDVWFRGMAQMFSTVSPEMHEEFDIRYMRRLMDRCGLAYYGCCEPLDAKLDLLMAIPNMRKLGVSPWSNVSLNAEKMGGGYVYSRKPNPAFVAGDYVAEHVRSETEETIKACTRYGCPYEFVLKDISTVSYKPGNLIGWTKTVMDTIDGYYGRSPR